MARVRSCLRLLGLWLSFGLDDNALKAFHSTLAQRIAAWIKGPKQMKALNKIFGSLFMLVGALLASARHA